LKSITSRSFDEQNKEKLKLFFEECSFLGSGFKTFMEEKILTDWSFSALSPSAPGDRRIFLFKSSKPLGDVSFQIEWNHANSCVFRLKIRGGLGFEKEYSFSEENVFLEVDEIHYDLWGFDKNIKKLTYLDLFKLDVLNIFEICGVDISLAHSIPFPVALQLSCPHRESFQEVNFNFESLTDIFDFSTKGWFAINKEIE
jgi:hypothetical protein